MQIRKVLIGIVLVTLLGCAGKEGPMGPQGPQGPTGTTLIKEYTGQFPSTGSFTLNVPEIKGNRASTYVIAYWAFNNTPDIWTPLADGWLDSANSKIFCVSWNLGQVGFFQMTAGDYYLIQVYQHN